jgi:hypothetical protein
LSSSRLSYGRLSYRAGCGGDGSLLGPPGQKTLDVAASDAAAFTRAGNGCQVNTVLAGQLAHDR